MNRLKTSLLLVMLCAAWLITLPCSAQVDITDATGGDAISADITSSATFTNLTGPSIAENNPGDLGTGTIVLNAPSGFIFDTNATVTVTVTGTGTGADVVLDSSTATVTATTITITIDSPSDTSRTSTLTWSGIAVQPTAGTPLASGDITESGTSSFLINSEPADEYGGLAEVAGGANSIGDSN